MKVYDVPHDQSLDPFFIFLQMFFFFAIPTWEYSLYEAKVFKIQRKCIRIILVCSYRNDCLF